MDGAQLMMGIYGRLEGVRVLNARETTQGRNGLEWEWVWTTSQEGKAGSGSFCEPACAPFVIFFLWPSACEDAPLPPGPVNSLL